MYVYLPKVLSLSPLKLSIWRETTRYSFCCHQRDTMVLKIPLPQRNYFSLNIWSTTIPLWEYIPNFGVHKYIPTLRKYIHFGLLFHVGILLNFGILFHFWNTYFSTLGIHFDFKILFHFKILLPLSNTFPLSEYIPFFTFGICTVPLSNAHVQMHDRQMMISFNK